MHEAQPQAFCYAKRKAEGFPHCAAAEPHSTCYAHETLLQTPSVKQSQPADQQLALVNHFWRQTVVQIQEQLFMAEHFLAPGFAVKRL